MGISRQMIEHALCIQSSVQERPRPTVGWPVVERKKEQDRLGMETLRTPTSSPEHGLLLSRLFVRPALKTDLCHFSPPPRLALFRFHSTSSLAIKLRLMLRKWEKFKL